MGLFLLTLIYFLIDGVLAQGFDRKDPSISNPVAKIIVYTEQFGKNRNVLKLLVIPVLV